MSFPWRKTNLPERKGTASAPKDRTRNRERLTRSRTSSSDPRSRPSPSRRRIQRPSGLSSMSTHGRLRGSLLDVRLRVSHDSQDHAAQHVRQAEVCVADPSEYGQNGDEYWDGEPGSLCLTLTRHTIPTNLERPEGLCIRLLDGDGRLRGSLLDVRLRVSHDSQDHASPSRRRIQRPSGLSSMSTLAISRPVFGS
jgi:hypothetical protein